MTILTLRNVSTVFGEADNGVSLIWRLAMFH